MGVTHPKALQLESLDEELRASLWNVCRPLFFYSSRGVYLRESGVYSYALAIYSRFYKVPVDDLPKGLSEFTKGQLEIFKDAKWYELLNLIEFLHDLLASDTDNQTQFVRRINAVLEREKSGYRFVAGIITPITNGLEIAEIEDAADSRDKFAAAAVHIRTAVGLYSKRPEADYRNSVKEAISAVESAVRIVSGKNSAVLGDALKVMDAAKPMHAAFKQALLKLYGYTSDEGGIRHSLLESPNIDESDARFMLIACSAFVNYCVSRS
jgi:hypothetical protein